MDRLDRKILAVLQGNARASLQEIGQAVGLSASPCWGRIKKMEEAGVIQGYTVRINPAQLEKLALKTNTPVDLLMRGDGDFVNGMDFVLRKKP